FEQGAGELNIEGAIRLALTLRKDVNFATASNGSTIVNAGISLPAPQSNFADSSFVWSQQIIAEYAFVHGNALVLQQQ
ncbi:hypothetical protein WAI05_23680, partial [Acinetobacter baumannii]